MPNLSTTLDLKIEKKFTTKPINFLVKTKYYVPISLTFVSTTQQILVCPT